MKVVGAIDVGSNAIRLSCAKLTSDGRIEIIDAARTSVRLGEDVFRTGEIGEETQQKLIDALKLYQLTLTKHQCSAVRAYATSAFRESKGQQDLLEKIHKETGIKLEMISGGKEASLLQKAVQSVLNLSHGSHMLADLGGGSLEITIMQGGQIQFAESFRLGTVRLLKMYQYRPEREEEFIAWLKQFLSDFLNFLTDHLKRYKVQQLILTGGNAVAIGRLGEKFSAGGSKFTPNLMELQRADFKKVKKELTNRSYDQRMTDFEMAPDRADVIIPAVFVFNRLMRLVGCEGLLIPDVGVRDGMLIELMEEYGPQRQTSDYQQVIHSAEFYAEKYQSNMKHCRTVQLLCGQMFDQLKEIHQLSNHERLLLEVAAIVHDVGRFVRPSNHHKHSMYLIRQMEIVGLTLEELNIVSLIARYHTRGAPSQKHLEYGELDKKQQKTIDLLVSILRIADSLDREHSSFVVKVALTRKKGVIFLDLWSSRDLLLAKWAFDSKKAFFEENYEVTLELQHQHEVN